MGKNPMLSIKVDLPNEDGLATHLFEEIQEFITIQVMAWQQAHYESRVAYTVTEQKTSDGKLYAKGCNMRSGYVYHETLDGETTHAIVSCHEID